MEIFPTGKSHVSYSEIKAWKECPYRHKLMYVDKIKTYEDNPYADFGTLLHEAIEKYLNGFPIKFEELTKSIKDLWETKGYDSKEYINKVKNSRSNPLNYKHETADDYIKSMNTILSDFPQWLDENFPDWELIKAEEELYEEITSGLNYKGFIDCIIKVPTNKKKTKHVYYIIDWKTTGKSGWYFTKRRDFLSLAQVGFYKKYWAEKNNVDLKSVRTAYVFLKRGAKKNKSIELFKVSAGPKFLQKAEKMLNDMIFNVKRGNKMKNYSNCKFCPFKQSEYCNGAAW